MYFGYIGVNYALATAFAEGKIHFIKQHPFTKRKGYIIYWNHNCSKLRRKGTILLSGNRLSIVKGQIKNPAERGFINQLTVPAAVMI